eukprot:1250302-Rhodomonas_salina.5
MLLHSERSTTCLSGNRIALACVGRGCQCGSCTSRARRPLALPHAACPGPIAHDLSTRTHVLTHAQMCAWKMGRIPGRRGGVCPALEKHWLGLDGPRSDVFLLRPTKSAPEPPIHTCSSLVSSSESTETIEAALWHLGVICQSIPALLHHPGTSAILYQCAWPVY